MKRLFSVAAGLLVAAVFVTPVFAATIEVGAALGQFEPYVNAALSVGIMALVGFILWQLKTRFNIEIDAGHRATIEAWLTNQAKDLVAKGAVSIKDAKIEVKSDALALAANTLLRSAPDAAAHFGLTPEAMKDKLTAAVVAVIPSVPAAPAA